MTIVGRRALVVVGVHRSATSAVTRVLSLLGADLPRRLMPPAPENNATGFWEPSEIVELDDRILASAGSRWDDPSPISGAWFTSDAAREFEDELIELIDDEFGESPLFVVKDPRISRIVPLWKSALGRMGIDPAFVIPVRNPLEVAASLEKRNDFLPAKSFLLWLRHILEVERGTRDARRSIVSYEALLCDWRATTEKIAADLQLTWPRTSRQAAPEIERFVSDEHRHHRSSRDELEARADVVSWVKDIYGAAAAAAAGGTVPTKRFDRVWGNLEEADLVYGPLLGQAQAEIAETSDRVRKVERSLQAQEEGLRRLRAELTAEREGRARAEADLATESAASEELRGALARASAEVDEIRTELAQRSTEMKQVKLELDRIHRSRLWRWTQPVHPRSAGGRPAGQLRARSLSQLLSWIVKRPSLERIGYVRTYFKLRHSGLFDFDFYLARYADVAEAAVNPLMHYIEFGVKEGRDPRPGFSTLRYLDRHPDVRRSGMNPLLHALLTRGVLGTEPAASAAASTEQRETPSGAPAGSSPGAIRAVRRPRPPARSALLGLPDSGAREVDAQVSVIVLNRDGEVLLDRFFERLKAWLPRHSLEVILVDHGSKDGSVRLARRWESRIPLRIEEVGSGLTFAASNNRAAEIARGSYLLFLNNDVLVGEANLGEMLRVLQAPEVGAVGMRLHDASGTKSEVPGAIQHIGIRFGPWDRAHRFLRPYNVRPFEDDALLAQAPISVPAATGAALLCRRDDFLALGGFAEEYVYGYEDVDLCLKIRTRLERLIASANQTGAVHLEGWSRRRVDRETTRQRRLENIGVLWRRFGYAIRKEEARRALTDDGSWTGRRLSVGFAVTEAHGSAAAGDFHAAFELGEMLSEKLGWEVTFLPKDAWYEPCELDVVIAMTDQYDPAWGKNARPDSVTIAWMRNWFDRWVERPAFADYDLYLAASTAGARFVEQAAGVEVHILRLGTNPRRFSPGGENGGERHDYVFTGSHWGVRREITEALDPSRLPLRGAVYGRGWDANPSLRTIWKGFKPYEELPAVYRSTKIVVDDANHATKRWGSVNSRVFDALASGALVLTNGEIGSDEVFSGLLPTYRDRGELESLLQRYAGDDAAREQLVDRLRAIVLEEHTYDRRADELLEIVRRFRESRYRVAIKTPVPSYEVAHEWGDFHFARALKKALKKRGHRVRIDILPEWEREESLADDVVVVLRGLSAYRPRPGQINVLWNISHPDKLTDDEYELYDHVFVASLSYAEELSSRLAVPVTPLLQCTDPEVFKPSDESGTRHELLFVGNTRKQFRPAVKQALEVGLPLSVFGAGWDAFIDEARISGTHIPQDELHKAYAGSAIVLNDHWPSMAEKGFISNRIFDVAASGGFVLTDPARGLEVVFGDAVPVYESATDLREAAEFFLAHAEARREKSARLRELVLADHTFEHRADRILEVVDELDARLMAGPTDEPLPDRAGMAFVPESRVSSLGSGPSPVPAPTTVAEPRRRASARANGQASRRPPWYPDGMKRVNMGCGPRHVRAEWWNVDIRSFPGVDQVLDATKRWPFPDASLEYVFGEHFLEHLDLEGAITFLEEARRCLTPGGRIRLSTPSLEWVVATHFRLGELPAEARLADSLKINRAFHGWGHQFLYSRPMLAYVLEQCGFAGIEFYEYGESRDESLRNLEQHGEPSRNGGYPSIWIVEATVGNVAPRPSKELRERILEDYLRYVRAGH